MSMEKALEHTLEAAEMFQRCADIAREGEEVSHFVNAARILKIIAQEMPKPPPKPPHYESNIIDYFEHAYKRQSK
jgi:hypothetical protein